MAQKGCAILPMLHQEKLLWLVYDIYDPLGEFSTGAAQEGGKMSRTVEFNRSPTPETDSTS